MGLFSIQSEHFDGEVKVIAQAAFSDHRGFFSPTFRADEFRELGLPYEFVQDNYSYSTRNVLRGLHFQKTPPMGKLMRCTQGRAMLVTVDVRPYSKSFLMSHSIEISDENLLQVWAPAGFARGFYAYSDSTAIQYKCTGYFDAAGDTAIRWNDPMIGIRWPSEKPIVSTRDANAPTAVEYFRTAMEYFRSLP